MGWLDTLTSIGKIGAGVAAPFTGGASLALLPALNAVGQIAGNAAGSKSDQRMQTGALQNTDNRNAVDLYSAQQAAQNQAANLDLQRKQFGEGARGNRAKEALIGSLLGNLSDVSVNVPGIQNATVTGGLRPSAMGEGGKQAANNLMQQALLAQLNPDKFSGGEMVAPPKMQGLPQAGGLEKTLDMAGLLGSLAGGIGGAIGGGQQDASKFIPKINVASGAPSGLPGGIDPRLLEALNGAL